MKHQILFMGVVTAFLGAAAPAAGQTVQCAGIQRDLAELQDGALFYRPRGSAGWTSLPLGGTLAITRPMNVDFIYVAREYWLQGGRPGLVIIKSGHTLASGPVPDGPEMVNLRRIERGGEGHKCEKEKTASFFGSVSGESYDRYHDASLRIPPREETILEDFHTPYRRRGGECRDSNWTRTDTFAGRTNRRQFSFSDAVVDSEGTNRIFAAISIGSLYARAFRERAVEVRRYRTDANRLACVAFTRRIAPTGYFLKINDLERVKGSNERFPERGDESRWNSVR